ncbi:uncharacterized protein ACIBXB_020786 [Morphnus guianensis]
MGTRKADGHPTTVPHHPLGLTEKTEEDLRNSSERAGTGLVPGTPDPSLALPTSMGMRRTGDGQPTTVPHHPLGMTEKTTKDLRTTSERAGTSPVPGTPDTSLALPTSMGTRRTGDGHPTTVTHHPIGMTGKTTKDLRTASERAGTGSRGLAPAALPGLNFPARNNTHRGPPPACQGNRPFCKSSHSLPGTSQPGVKEQQHSASPQPLVSCKGGVLSSKQTAQGPPAASKKVPEPPSPASSPQKSPATDPRAATEAAEPEQAAEAASVEPGAGQKPAGSHSQVETALETEPAPSEKSPAGTGEQLEVEPCSQSVPKAGAGGGSHPHSPTAPPEPAEKVHAAAGSAGEAGAELCPCSGGEQHLQNGAEEAKGEAACDELLGVLQPSDDSQVLPGATVEPDAQPSQACSDICAAPETSPGTQHPPGSGETELAADSQHQLCSTLPTPSPASTDLRSAAVLARKEEIELSYQQFSLTIAVVATMLLQKEPSMEAALGLALRANLRQGRIHHLQELEDFIDSYDSATLSR